MQKYYPHPNKLLLSDLFMPLWMNPGGISKCTGTKKPRTQRHVLGAILSQVSDLRLTLFQV